LTRFVGLGLPPVKQGWARILGDSSQGEHELAAEHKTVSIDPNSHETHYLED